MTKKNLDKQIIKLWIEGKSYREIAHELYCSEAHISRVINEHKTRLQIAGKAAVEAYFAGASAKDAIEAVRSVLI